MKHRCYNCKCLEEESTYQAHKRKKHDLKAKFYCKKCRKSNSQPAPILKDTLKVPVKEKIPRRRFERIPPKVTLKRRPLTLKEKFDKAREGLSVEEGIAIGRLRRKCPVNCKVEYIVPIEQGGLHRLSNLRYVPLSVGDEEQEKGVENSDASTSTCESINNNYFRLEEMVRRSKYMRLRVERKIKNA